MHRFILTILAFLVATATASAAAPAKPASSSHLLIISVDGLPYDTFVVNRDRLPTLSKLATRGVHGASETVFPSMTWPSHASLVTGSYPARHGVLGNRIYDRRRAKVLRASVIPYSRLYRAPTLMDLTREAKMTTAAILWAGSQRAPNIDWNIPEVYQQKQFVADSTPGLLEELRAAGLPTHQLGRFSHKVGFLQDSFARDAAIHLVTKHKPTVNLLHFLMVDGMSHRYGPRNRMVSWALELLDRYVADVLAAYRRAGILHKTNVMIVADHGFHRIARKLDADKLLVVAGLTPPGKQGRSRIRTVSNGHALFVYIKGRRGRTDLSKRVAEVLGRRREVKRVLRPKHFKALGLPTSATHSHAPDLIVLSHADTVFGRVKRKGVVRTTGGGMHGSLPTDPLMRPVFIAAGPGIVANPEPLRSMRNIDVAPTAATLLGLRFKTPIDGVPRGDVLKVAPSASTVALQGDRSE